jgi:alkanesulfonate monooxygenase SsuD/methylene tetrahydromethanopterin reductase-like flavin-dependent oxidoreductase (luciferase family)/putative sterol carrier protein
MKFGIFYELQRPRPWGPDGEEKVVHEALDQVELADRLGFHSVWEVEHHFLEEYSHSSAPEVFLAAASQRTKRIRLGHGIVQLPPGFNHPARVAERIGMLDLVSGGRVEFGTGEGSSQSELGGFGVTRELKHNQWDESLHAIVRMMTEEPFTGHDGRFLSMPPRNVIPKPKQKPHPPLWVACSRRETILEAARKGIGALSFSFVEPEAAKAWVDDYYKIIASPECVPAGLAVNPQVAVVLPFMCHEDEQTAIDRGIDGAQFFGFSLAYYYVFGKHQPGISNIWETFLKQRKDYGFARELIRADDRPLGVKLLEEGLGSLRGSVGTPTQLVELLSRYERAGVDLVIFAAQAGNNRHEHICEGLELFAKSVMPRFAEREEVHQAEKRERLAGAVEQALARRAPTRAMTSEYFITPQGESGPVGTVRVYPQSSPAPAHAAAANGRGSAVLGWLVRDRTDRQIERMMPLLAPVIFKGMQRGFQPQLSRGFSGEIQYDLRSNGKSRKWVVRIADGKATARRGASADPSVTMRMSEAVFARIAAGIIPSMAAMLEGKVEAEGDLNLLARLGEMFGAQSGF